ncbi:NAD-dependent epimerase/dehydratase family protein [Microbulbifer sp. TYP-18]|uniref:NAD-dependent epimerase/dehydratase family protein n=1 Tax=Microbulbifer sp. TYP-18 TaxID=3230024 RepID=UPI0034C5BE5A
MRKVLVTGANGFIGRALCRYLAANYFDVQGLVRLAREREQGIDYVELDLEKAGDLNVACHGVDCIVHLAGRAHVVSENDQYPLKALRKANCMASLRLARQAVRSGVRRFIFISSVGVNGPETSFRPFDEKEEEKPLADYAISKFEAEMGLKKFFTDTDTELVIIRPPLVYGVDAPGNFARLLSLIATELPLPFGRINNRRSIVSVDNLVSLIVQCIEHPAAAGQLFLVSDGEDISTVEIVQALARGMDKKSLIISVPDVLLKFGAKLLKKESLYVQLCRSLQIDSSKAQNLLDWKPMRTTTEMLEEVGRLYACRKFET